MPSQPVDESSLKQCKYGLLFVYVKHPSHSLALEFLFYKDAVSTDVCMMVVCILTGFCGQQPWHEMVPLPSMWASGQASRNRWHFCQQFTDKSLHSQWHITQRGLWRCPLLLLVSSAAVCVSPVPEPSQNIRTGVVFSLNNVYFIYNNTLTTEQLGCATSKNTYVSMAQGGIWRGVCLFGNVSCKGFTVNSVVLRFFSVMRMVFEEGGLGGSLPWWFHQGWSFIG